MTGPTPGEMGLTPKDMGIKPPAKEGLGRLDGFPKLKVIPMALDNGGVIMENRHPKLNVDRLLEIKDQLYGELASSKDPFQIPLKSDFEQGIEIPTEYNFEKRARKMVRDVIGLYKDSGIIDRDILVQGGMIAGPDNIDTAAELNGVPAGIIDPSKHVDQLPKGTEPIDKYIYPSPNSKEVRNENVKLGLHKDVIRYSAASIIDVAKKSGITLTPEAALDIAIAKLTIHEMGHAYDMAIANLGSSTFQKEQLIPDESVEGLLRKSSVTVHSEHLARGLEDTLLPSVLVNVAGLNEGDAKNLTAQINYGPGYELIEGEDREALGAYFSEGLARSVDPIMLSWTEKCLADEAKKIYDDGDQEKGIELSYLFADTSWHSCYRLPPYTPDEVRFLMNRGEAATK